MDSVEIALNTIYISLLIAATCAAFVASRNLASSTLAISTAALVGAAVVFALQTYFELQPGSDIDHVGTDFTLDASAPFIRQWTYPNYSSRPSVEISASNWLKVNNPGAFSNRDKLFSDFTIFSFIAFMMTTEFDWQLRKWVYPGGSLGTSTTVQPISKPEECKIYLLETLREKLKLAGNVFADAPITAVAPNRLCLPPDTNLKITSRSITFENYFYRATWTLDQGFTVMSHTGPGTGDMPILTSGIPQYETRVSGLTADVIYFRFRAKSPTMPKVKPGSIASLPILTIGLRENSNTMFWCGFMSGALTVISLTSALCSLELSLSRLEPASDHSCAASDGNSRRPTPAHQALFCEFRETLPSASCGDTR